MPPLPPPDPGEEAKAFYERLEQQLADVQVGEDTSQLPARITHVRYPDGTVKRIRFTNPGYRGAT
jgi:hypothetical protein